MQSFSNRHLTVGLDGIVKMSEEDAACLIPAGWIKLPDGAATTYRQKAEALRAEKERDGATPTKTNWAPGSMEWQAEQDKSS